MINFLPVSILAYSLNAGAILIDKILLRQAIPHPLTYTFYISLLGGAVVLLAPFGFSWSWTNFTWAAVFSGITFVGALYTFFLSLKHHEASVVGPLVGALNPLSALVMGAIFLEEMLTSNQLVAFGVLIVGAGVLTFNMWFGKVKWSKDAWSVPLSGFLFGLSYLFLRVAFLEGSFLDGLIVSRAVAAILALSWLLIPTFRTQLLPSPYSQATLTKVGGWLVLGQGMGALSSLLLFYGTYLAHPALVNALFGVQYVVILVVALLLVQKHPLLLGEQLGIKIVVQKIIGATVLSLGLYLLAQ